MYSSGERFDRIRTARAADAPDLADVRTAGRGATAPGGHPSQMGVPAGPPFPTIARVSEAATFVDARIAEGSDFIKIIYDDLAALGMKLPMLDDQTVRAGLTPVQALTAATSAPARAFGLTDRGRISPGLRADLLLVDGDPTTDILASRRIVMLWKRGSRVDRFRYEG